MRYGVAVLGIIVFLAGCASVPPTNYYTLNMNRSADADSLLPIEIGRISVSEALAKRNILIQKSPTEIEYYASDQWVAGLEELVSEKLAVELQQDTSQERALYLTGTLMAFGQVDRADGADAHLKMAVHITNIEDDSTVLRRTFDVVVPAKDAQPLAVVEALSACLERLAQQIRDSL